jgi:hypothetical protein
MERIPCPELCPDCPLAEVMPAESRQLEQSKEFIAKGKVVHHPEGDKVTFDFERGRPVGRHLIEVGLIPEGGDQGLGFWVDSSLSLSDIASEFEICTGPKYTRVGFLKLGKQAVCGAVSRFAEES